MVFTNRMMMLYNIHASRIAGNGYFGHIWFDSISYPGPPTSLQGVIIPDPNSSASHMRRCPSLAYGDGLENRWV